MEVVNVGNSIIFDTFIALFASIGIAACCWTFIEFLYKRSDCGKDGNTCIVIFDDGSDHLEASARRALWVRSITNSMFRVIIVPDAFDENSFRRAEELSFADSDIRVCLLRDLPGFIRHS